MWLVNRRRSNQSARRMHAASRLGRAQMPGLEDLRLGAARLRTNLGRLVGAHRERRTMLGLRDPRIDFFRGLAIYMIFVDHVIGDPFAKITYRNLGFSDAAEIFFFLSGLVCGIAYAKILARQGLSVFMSAIAKRAWRIYLYYALSSVAIILIVTAAVNHKELGESFGISTEHPLSAAWSALCLVTPPTIAGILVLYIVLTLAVVPALLVAGDRYRAPALAASGLIWVGSQIFADFVAPLTHRWYLNPFAWQFLFAIGVFVGMKWDSERPILPFPSQRRRIVIAAWAIVIGSFLYRLLSSHSGFDIAWLRLDPATLSSMKENLSPVRLLHFLSVALLVSVYFRRDNALLKWSVSRLMIKIGQHSLEIFSLSVVFDVLLNIVVLTGAPSLSERILMDGIAFLLLALSAIALAYRRETVLKRRI
jgi:hypothetical protein